MILLRSYWHLCRTIIDLGPVLRKWVVIYDLTLNHSNFFHNLLTSEEFLILAKFIANRILIVFVVFYLRFIDFGYLKFYNINSVKRIR